MARCGFPPSIGTTGIELPKRRIRRTTATTMRADFAFTSVGVNADLAGWAALNFAASTARSDTSPHLARMAMFGKTA